MQLPIINHSCPTKANSSTVGYFQIRPVFAKRIFHKHINLMPFLEYPEKDWQSYKAECK